MGNTTKLDKFIRVSDKLKADLKQIGKKGETYEVIIRRLFSEKSAKPVTVKGYKQ